MKKNGDGVVVQDGAGAVVKNDSCFFFCRKYIVGVNDGGGVMAMAIWYLKKCVYRKVFEFLRDFGGFFFN